MRTILKTIFIFIAFSILLNGCAGEDEQIVAKVGSQKITVKEFRDKLQEEYRNKALSELTLEQKQKTLREMLDTRRKVMWALEHNLDEDPVYQAELEKLRNRTIAINLYKQLVIGATVPEELIKQYYDWKHTRINAVVIKLGHNESQIVKHERSVDEARDLAQKYRDKLAKSKNAEEAARNLTDDKRNRPVLEPYTLGHFSLKVDSLVYTADVGEIVGPVNTKKYGFVIFKILYREALPEAGDYKSSKAELQQVLRGQLREKEKALFDKHSEEFQAKYSAEILEDGITEFLEVLKQWGENPERKVEDFTEAERNIALARINGEPFKASEFIDFFQSRLVRDFRQFKTVDDIKNGFVIPQLNLEAWVLEAKARGVHKNEEIAENIEKFKLSRLAQLVEEKQVAQNIEVSEEEIMQHYSANKEKYLIPEKIRIWQIPVKDENTAREVLRRAKRGADFGDLSQKYGVKIKGKPVQFDLSFQTRQSRYKEIVDAAFTAGANQVTGPVLVDGVYYIIKTGEHKEKQIRPLQQVKSSIYSEIFNEKKQQKREQLLNDIRNHYAYRINESILRSIS